MCDNKKHTRLRKEVELLKRSSTLHVYWEDESKLDEFKVELKGPEGSPYHKHTFIILVQVPDRYPFIPPVLTFLTPIYHPNIDPTGRICLEALKPKPAGSWNVTLNILTVLHGVEILLKEPNLSDPLMSEIASEYQTDYALYFKKASSRQ